MILPRAGHCRHLQLQRLHPTSCLPHRPKGLIHGQWSLRRAVVLVRCRPLRRHTLRLPSAWQWRRVGKHRLAPHRRILPMPTHSRMVVRVSNPVCGRRCPPCVGGIVEPRRWPFPRDSAWIPYRHVAPPVEYCSHCRIPTMKRCMPLSLLTTPAADLRCPQLQRPAAP